MDDLRRDDRLGDVGGRRLPGSGALLAVELLIDILVAGRLFWRIAAHLEGVHFSAFVVV